MSRLQTPVRRNDTVLVIAGKDRGKRGRVLKLLPERNRVVVEGVNVIKRHTRPNPSRNIKGGVVEREASLHASNLQLVCPDCGAIDCLARVVTGRCPVMRLSSSAPTSMILTFPVASPSPMFTTIFSIFGTTIRFV